ncbi:uncharacterized protein LOC108140922 [Drosophila elegans]|uniref:uncharacterized protein LOC108140922 n=1 Tax=Drosophila elegans TaxID=30023 RepID=UPI0007E7B212|nr:uncharacterized protein LOC108140922 [Drosophila elegans]
MEEEEEEVINVDDPLIINANKKRRTDCGHSVSSNSFQGSTAAGQAHILQSFETERMLIALVRRQPALYDARHPRFQDNDHRERIWLRIARHLSTDLTNCLVAWAELRSRYQHHVRHLRAFQRSAASGRPGSTLRRRPCMRHEEELHFLYAHVSRFPRMGDQQPPGAEAAAAAVEIASTASVDTIPEVEFVEPPPVDIIDVDLVEESVYSYRCTNDQRRLIEAVRAYPQLYDPQAPGYENTRHRGLIWGAISNELHDKATKLMKSWLKLQTRYEWELVHRPLSQSSSSSSSSSSSNSSELCQLMDFLRQHVLRQRNTVSKASKYLQTGWHEPIEHFRSVMSLINTMRNMPELVQLTDECLAFKVKPPRYDEFWTKVGFEVMCSHERCEVTWLVLRSFHNELQAMRLAGYQLQDKWYFENALSSIFKQVATRTARRGYKRPHNGAVLPSVLPPVEPAPPVARLPLAIVYPPASKVITSTSNSTSSSTSISTSSSSIISNARNSCGPGPTVTMASSSAESSVPSFVIPKITSAISVAAANMMPMKAPPPSIVPMKLPPNVRIAPKAPMGLGPIPASIQLAGTNASPGGTVRALPSRPGVQVTLKTRQRVPNPTQMTSSSTIIRAVKIANPMQAPAQSAPQKQTQPQPAPQPAASGVQMQRFSQPTSLNALLSDPPVSVVPVPVPVPSTPLPILKPAATLVRKMPANSSIVTAPAGTPMVRIHQPGLHSGWDALPNGSSTSKSMGSVTTTATITAATREEATSGKATVATILQKYRPIAPAPPGTIRISKAAVEPRVTFSAPLAPVGMPKVTAMAGTTAAKLATITTAATTKVTTASTASAREAKATETEVIAIPETPATVAPSATATIPAAATIGVATTTATAATSVAFTNAKTAAVVKTTAAASVAPQPDKETTAEINASEIIVHLEQSAVTGNLLHIWGGNLATRYNLNMVRTATLIREVMAVPQLHKKDARLAEKCDEVWKVISKKFHMPEEALRACWSFLADNISMFPLIAPMSELMRPFKSSVKVWEKSHRLFSKFDEIARKYLWMEHKDVLPDVIRHFRKHEHLYCDLIKPRPGEKVTPPRQYTDQERQEVWRVARIKFPNLNHRDIWSMFKFAFRTYMADLERGIENPWPQNWWQALEQLRFLAYVRYHPLEPYYYIVHNKISEEVKRCSMYEALMAADPADKSKPTPSSLLARLSKESMPWETEEAKRLLTGQLSRPGRSEAAFQLSTNALAPVAQPHTDPVPSPKAPMVESTASTKQTTNDTGKCGNGVAATAPATENTRFGTILPTIEAFQLTQVLRRHPHTFERASTIDKRAAWVRVSKEMNATVTECRLCLQYALREMRVLKITDPTHRCTMGHKYYRHMTEIYKQVTPRGQLKVRTPQQLNQSLAEPILEVVPQRFVPEINTATCSPELVVKNWAHAVGNLSHAGQDALTAKLTQLFAKYAKEPT